MSVRQAVEIVDTIDKNKKSRLKGIRTVDHMNTATTKNTNKFAELMEKNLTKLTRKIVQMLDKNKTLDEIREELKVEVGSVISNGIRESYMLGLHFIEQFAERTARLTPEHLLEIDAQIQDTITRFWGGIQREIRKRREEEDTKIFGAAFDGELFRRLAAFLTGTSQSASFMALGAGTLTTHRQIFSQSILQGGITVTGNIAIPKLIWITERDDRVCPICQPLDGQTFNADEPNIPRPVQNTHDNCRCRLLPLEKGKVFNA